MDTLTYWNGTWHEGNPAILGPRDHAFWLGSIVFDGGRAFEGCGPDLDLHAERVVRSAHVLGLKPTKTAQEILELMHEAIRRFGPKAEQLAGAGYAVVVQDTRGLGISDGEFTPFVDA